MFYSLDISFLNIPLFGSMFTIYYSEKKIRNRIFYLMLVFLIFSQFSTPYPLVFLILISLQMYLFTIMFFASTAFEFSLTALLNTIAVIVLANLNKMLYLLVFTDKSNFGSIFVETAVASFIIIVLYNFFKPAVTTLFIKDSWL